MSEEKKRHEFKFLVKLADAEVFFQEIQSFCKLDKHAEADGAYEIASLYYDTSDLRFYFDREESLGFRRKVRLRSYNSQAKSTALFLEIKERHRSLVAKKRIAINSKECLKTERQDLITLDSLIKEIEDSEARREVLYLHGLLDLKPIAITRYRRKILIPIHSDDIRITLDLKLTSGGKSLEAYVDSEEEFICPPEMGILEIKSTSTLPIWLQSALGRSPFFRTRYSKYCNSVAQQYRAGKLILLSQQDRAIEQTLSDDRHL